VVDLDAVMKGLPMPRRLKSFNSRICQAFLLALCVSAFSVAGMAQAKAPASTSAAAKSADTQSDAQIADAKSKGMVWVNTGTKVYHKDDQFYGKTKHGKFMTEADAQKAGFKEAKASPIGKKKTAAPAK
jgi:hypothetical protein